MLEIVQVCGILTSTMVAVLASVFLVICLINSAYESSWRRAESETRSRVEGDLHTIERWMGNDFPIVEDVADYLRDRLNESTSVSMSDFRDGMREKYCSAGHKPIKHNA